MNSDSTEQRSNDTGQARRQHWLSVMAKASADELEAEAHRLAPLPGYGFLRAPEAGMVMLRGRTGGTGDRFNLGELTVTRCSLRLDNGAIGHGYAAGRDRRKSELVALFDALLQGDDGYADRLAAAIDAWEAAQKAEHEDASRKAAATKVEFFTVARER